MCNPSALPSAPLSYTFPFFTPLCPPLFLFFIIFHSCLPLLKRCFWVDSRSFTDGVTCKSIGTSVCVVYVCVCVCCVDVRAWRGLCLRACVCYVNVVCWRKKRSPGSPSWQERISRTLYTDSLRFVSRHVAQTQPGSAASNYLATVSDFQESLFFLSPRNADREENKNKKEKPKHCPISLTLNRHNHSEVTAGNLKYGPG